MANVTFTNKRKIVVDGEIVGEFFGNRETTHKFGAIANFWFVINGERIDTHCAYVSDVKKAIKEYIHHNSITSDDKLT